MNYFYGNLRRRIDRHTARRPRVNLYATAVLPFVLGHCEDRLCHYNLTFAFVDGDHTYNGVKADTQMLFRVMNERHIIVWHDYHLEGGPAFIGVRDYLHDMIGVRFRHISGTTLAVHSTL